MNNLRQHIVAAALAVVAYAFLPATAGAANLTISGCDTLTVVSANEVSCSATPAAPGAPTGCTISPTPLSLPAIGGDVSLSGGCTGGPALGPTSWTRGVTSVTSPDTLPSNSQGTSLVSYTYTGKFCAQADSTLCTTASKTVTVAAGAAPAPSPTTCGNLGIIEPFMQDNPSVRTLTFNGARFLTSGFGGNTTNVVVGKIEVPQTASGLTSLSVYEYASNKTTRRIWLSKNRCDFSGTGPYNPLPGAGPTAYIKIGGTNDSSKVMMQPGETWYVMVKNESIVLGTIKSSCSSGTCDIGMAIAVPQ